MGNIYSRKDGYIYLGMVQIDISKLISFLEEVVLSSRILNLIYEADEHDDVFVNFGGRMIFVRKSRGKFFIDLELLIHDRDRGIFDRSYQKVLTGEGEDIDNAMKDVIFLLRPYA